MKDSACRPVVLLVVAACVMGPGSTLQDRVKSILTLNCKCSFSTGEI